MRQLSTYAYIVCVFSMYAIDRNANLFTTSTNLSLCLMTIESKDEKRKVTPSNSPTEPRVTLLENREWAVGKIDSGKSSGYGPETRRRDSLRVRETGS